MSIQASDSAAEISGYADIGMKKEALWAARRVLGKRRILPDEFSEALRTIGVFANFKKWRPMIEDAYNRQSRVFKRKARTDMLELYASLEEWRTALAFVSIRRPARATDFFFGMNVLLELEKIEEAEALAMRCKKILPLVTAEFDRSLLYYALGQFFARTHQWESTLAAWQATAPDSSIARNVLTGIVKIHLARAFEAVQAGLRCLADRKRREPNKMELCLPKLEFDLAVDAEKELLKFNRGIEKLLPEKVRKELGIAVTTGATCDG